MRTASPWSSGSRLASATMEPSLPRIGATSSGVVESNTSQTVSARRNNAAGVAVAKENVRCRPSLSRSAPNRGRRCRRTLLRPAAATPRILGGVCAGTSGVSPTGAGFGVSGSVACGAGDGCGAASGLMARSAVLAIFSGGGGAASPDFCGTGRFPAGFLERGRRGDHRRGFRWRGRTGRSRGRGGGRRHGRSGIQRCRGRRQRRGFSRLLERDIDNVVLVLAEGMDIDIADQPDFDGGGFAVDLLIDRCDVRRRRDLGVGEIEIERGVELQREFLIVEYGRNVDAARHFKHEADEGRLHRRTDANRRTLLRRRRSALQTQRAFGGARAFGQFAYHLGGKARRRTAPAIRQQIDEHPLAGRHGVDGHPARQRQPDRRTIGIAPRRSRHNRARRRTIGRPEYPPAA